jgi:hypothetical protein
MKKSKEKKHYKVFTSDLKSLGLRKNPNILQFAPGETHQLPDNQIEEGQGDWGGIWVTSNRSGAKKITEYMLEKYDIPCRIFEVQVGDILYQNNYRLKTDSVLLLAEVFYMFQLANHKLRFAEY